ncbi:hypothetical protein GCM10010994_59750 [Chelatococcus reniformis]|uniref:Uncharacterized protein n=1 Tax=Chelatococcus reniformis TaxID=1494448 RepID=A0A916XQ26_9HYPH|nr:hypothetical protein GCM10010994_59750 [Chelatococcus reniformis]
MRFRKGDHDPLVPKWHRIVSEQLINQLADNGDIDRFRLQALDQLLSRAFNDLNLHIGKAIEEHDQRIPEAAASKRCPEPKRQAAELAATGGSSREGRALQITEDATHRCQELRARPREDDAAMMPLKQRDAENVLQGKHTSAYDRLPHA